MVTSARAGFAHAPGGSWCIDMFRSITDQEASAMSPSPYVVRQDAVTPYSPLNHAATVNRRLVGRDNVGARQLEVVLGVVARGGGALKHSHPGIEQACYVLEGRGRGGGGGDYGGEWERGGEGKRGDLGGGRII